jgi:hypothetical protein
MDLMEFEINTNTFQFSIYHQKRRPDSCTVAMCNPDQCVVFRNETWS